MSKNLLKFLQIINLQIKIIMALEIKEEHGILKIIGTLNTKTSLLATNHMRKLLDIKDKMLVSLEEVKFADDSAIFNFETLYLEAINLNKILVLFGLENKSIKDTLKRTNTNYIFSPDRE
ncbi:hypothetical protein [uncultured Croceitalea sp.]|uniref:hypothetical protein n=2 Tax=uncultured Croceitalea sp. TaxID=1798908 RepID=UPI0033060312